MDSVHILHVEHLVVVGVRRHISSGGCRFKSRVAEILEDDGFRVRMGVDGWQVSVPTCVSHTDDSNTEHSHIGRCYRTVNKYPEPGPIM